LFDSRSSAARFTPSDRSGQALLDIRENIILAQTFAVGLTETDLSGDRKAFYAITRCLEIISEASRRLDDNVKRKHPIQPWDRIAAAGKYLPSPLRQCR
jgi:uncharacterized protein with HEPN domain